MNDLLMRRRVLFSNNALKEDPSSTDGWIFNKRFNTVGLVDQEGCCVTRKYIINGGDSIKTCVPDFGPANIGVWGFTGDDDANGYYLTWINRGDKSGSITIPNDIKYVQFSLIVSCLSTTYLLNLTSQKYIYKGVDVE